MFESWFVEHGRKDRVGVKESAAEHMAKLFTSTGSHREELCDTHCYQVTDSIRANAVQNLLDEFSTTYSGHQNEAAITTDR